MSLTIGPGLAAWLVQHQATPLTSEFGYGSPWQVSVVEILIANEFGKPCHALVGWDGELGHILEPGPGVPTAPATWPIVNKQVGSIPEKEIEHANQQGYDSTCGFRVLMEALMEDGLLAVDAAAGKALLDEMWDKVLDRPLYSEQTTGMGLWDQLQGMLYMANKFGKYITYCPLKAAEDARPATAAAGPRSLVFPGTSVAIDHMTAGVWLEPLLGIDSNHFVLKRKDDVDADPVWHILDSCHDVDGDPDVFTVDQVVGAAEAIFGAGDQLGWAFTMGDGPP